MRRVAVLLVLALVACKSDQKSGEKPHHHEDRSDPATAAPALSLAVTIDGTPATWGADAFAKVTKSAATNNGGESRDVWSLRELAHTLVGPSARVVSVTGESGAKPIDAAAWADSTRTPILQMTRRGTLKFRWANAAGAWDSEAEMKDVTKLEVLH
ncbi:MAG TPA: hypothetical protein VFV99_30650 [Kofleriaceae bacterium]|nr:hypothetical protein [Kofleriaceae bacterium]